MSPAVGDYDEPAAGGRDAGVAARVDGFDLQAHRGGLGLTVENTLSGFARALELGVTTLECDMHVSLDGHAVVVHDRRLSAEKYRDTDPVMDGDPHFPYVGGLVTDLTLAQLRTLDAGSHTSAEHPAQAAAPGARIPTLAELIALADSHGAHDMRFNVETKFDAVSDRETAPRETFASTIVAEAHAAGVVDRLSVQSFDWQVLRVVRELEPRLRLIVLAAPKYLMAGKPGASPWLGGPDIDDFGGDLVAAVAAEGFDAISPVHGYPFASGVSDSEYRPFCDAEMIARAHRAGLAVIPYTVDDPATMRALIDAGVDGLISNYPDRVREVLAALDLPLPPAYPAP